MNEQTELMQKMEVIGALASRIAHNFNNKLCAITGNMSYALSFVKPDDELYEVCSDVLNSAQEAHTLTRQLLVFSKSGEPARTLTNINTLLKEAVTASHRGAAANCHFDLSDDLWPAYVDEGQIKQAIGNLVINANQAMPNGGTLSIRTKNAAVGDECSLSLPEGNIISILIEDHGVGIPKEHLTSIFDPFFTTRQKGGGLGLAIVYSIIHRHGGDITVSSEPERGTVFSIYLPAAANEAEDVER